MKVIKVNLKERSYDIIVGHNLLALSGRYLSSLKIGNSAYIITNSLIKIKYGNILERSLRKHGIASRFKLIPDSEKSKSLSIASSVIRDLARYDNRKKVFVIAFGGGVAGDLAGFVSSIYKRGVPYVQIPTTLLAQVDSSIGGKTAVDLAEAKNLAGSFYQPKMVLSDVKLLSSLNKRQIGAGLAEVIKYGIIRDKNLFSYLEKNMPKILALKRGALEYIVYACGKIKADIVSKDEREKKGMRTILNFGHTAAHAIEAACGYGKYNHGEAVGLGMLVASGISDKIGLLKPGMPARIEKIIKTAGLPTKISNVPLTKIISAHYRDKKFIGSKNRFVLLRDIGRTKILCDVPLALIKKEIKARF
jgi:3-dehydroquinate synthase